MEEIMTVFKASKYCNVSPKTIINWIESGHIKAYKTVGGHRRIKKSDLEAFMKNQGIPIPEGEHVEERKRILVVDDDPIIVETIVQSLEEDEYDYEVISASDGFEAGLQVNHFRPHLLILDIMMPEISGWDVAAKIKENPKWKSIPIIFLTAKGDTMSIGMGGLAADDYIVKPFNIEDLKNRVNKILNKI